jgi:hypothetical protein
VAQRASVEVYVGFQPPAWLFTAESFQDRFLEGMINICFGDGSTQVKLYWFVLFFYFMLTWFIVDHRRECKHYIPASGGISSFD